MASVITLETGVDRTVRPISMKHWRDCDASMGPQYVGPDHCSLEGAKALVQRLKAHWAAEGEKRDYVVYPAVNWQDRDQPSTVYGIKAFKWPPKNEPRMVVSYRPIAPLEIGETPRSRIRHTIKNLLMVEFPGVRYETALTPMPTGSGFSNYELQARRACIIAVNDAFPNLGLERLGIIFGGGPTSMANHLSVRQRQMQTDRQRERERIKREARRRQEQAVAA